MTRRLDVLADRVLDRMRSRGAHEVASTAPTGSIDDFAGRHHCVLVTYRKDGTPVPSPVWFGTADGKLYMHTGGFKRLRLKRDPKVLVAPSTFRGTPTAPPLAGTARLLDPDEASKAEAAIQSNFGVGRRIYYRTVGRTQLEDGTYVEITPDAGGEPAA